jgi:hypothetical protein
MSLIENFLGVSGLDDGYAQQNMFRVIDGLVAVLDADPESIFRDPPDGTSHTSRLEGVLVARKGKLQLLSSEPPWNVLSEQPITPTFRSGAQWVSEAKWIVAHTEEALFEWDPRIANGIKRLRNLPLAIGISQAAHCYSEGTLVSALKTYDGRFIVSRDFEEPSLIHQGDPFEDIALLANGQIFSLSDHEIVEVINAEEPRTVVDEERLVEAIRRHPDSPKEALFINNSSLGTTALKDREVISYKAQLRDQSGLPWGTAILFWDPITWTEVGAFVLPKAIAMGFTIGTGPSGVVRLWASLISSRLNAEPDLIVWSDAITTRYGLMFRRSGSFGRHSDDLTHIVAIDEKSGFVADGSGRVMFFSKETGSLQPVSSNEEETIWSLELLKPASGHGA